VVTVFAIVVFLKVALEPQRRFDVPGLSTFVTAYQMASEWNSGVAWQYFVPEVSATTSNPSLKAGC
jgi:hypothetical protein